MMGCHLCTQELTLWSALFTLCLTCPSLCGPVQKGMLKSVMHDFNLFKTTLEKNSGYLSPFRQCEITAQITGCKSHTANTTRSRLTFCIAPLPEKEKKFGFLPTIKNIDCEAESWAGSNPTRAKHLGALRNSSQAQPGCSECCSFKGSLRWRRNQYLYELTPILYFGPLVAVNRIE